MKRKRRKLIPYSQRVLIASQMMQSILGNTALYEQCKADALRLIAKDNLNEMQKDFVINRGISRRAVRMASCILSDAQEL